MENYEGTDRKDDLNPPPPPKQPAPDEPRPTLAEWLRANGPLLILVVVGLVFLGRVANLFVLAKVAVGLGLVIFIHELGHFLVAKWCDVHVEAFSIGFGPALPGCSFRRGETTYMIALFPLGGYVKMVGEGGENDEDDDDPRSFKNKSVGQRMAIISAGVVMNVILACVCFVFVYSHGTRRPAGVVGMVDPGGRAWEKGLPSGAVLLQMGNSQPSHEFYFSDLKSAVLRSQAGEALKVVYRGPDEDKERTIFIEPRVAKDDKFPVLSLQAALSLTLGPEEYRRAYPAPVEFNSPASAARQPFEFHPGDVVVSATDPDDADHPDHLKPLPETKPQQNLFELSERWLRLAGKPIVMEIRRRGARANAPPEKVAVQAARFQFGDTIVATTDPAHPDQVAPLPDDPRRPPGSFQPDYFAFQRRLQLLAGQLMTVEVRRQRGDRHQEERVRLVIAPAYHYSLGARMRMGAVAAVREKSPGHEAGVLPGDMLRQVILKNKDQEKRFVILPDGEKKDAQLVDPMRLPYELERWADGRSGVEVVLTVLRDHGQTLHEPQTLKEVKWDSRWRFDEEMPLSRMSPLAIPGLGIAYHVKTTVDDVVGPPAEGALLKDDVIKGIRFPEPGKKAGAVEPGEWAPLEADQWPSTFYALQRAPFRNVTVKVERDKSVQEVALDAIADATWPASERGFIFKQDDRILKADNLGQAVFLGLEDTFQQIRDVYAHIRGMASGRISVDNMAGPITIFRMAYGSAGVDFWAFLFLIGAISVNLAVINFMPIPILDGGHMVFLIYEKIRGKPAPEPVRLAATYLGLALILSLMVFVLYLDFKRLLTG